MRLSVALPLLAASATLAAGCGGSSGAASGPSAGEPTTTTAAHPLPQSELLVLTQGDAGHGFWTVPQQTRAPEASARVTAAWNRQAVRSLPHAKAVAIQGAAPGRGAVLVRALVNANGHTIPLWIVQWRRGPVIGAAGIFGPGTTAARALALARMQDHRIALAIAG